MANVYRYCFGEKKLVCLNDNAHVQPDQNNIDAQAENKLQKKLTISKIDYDKNNFSILTSTADCYQLFDKFFSQFEAEVVSLELKESDYVKIIKLFKNLLIQNQDLCFDLCGKTCNTSIDYKKSCEPGTDYSVNKLDAISSIYKQRKKQQQNTMFVEPEEKAIGLKWKCTTDLESQIPSHSLVQSTFQYVPILKSLESLFSQQKFQKMYMDYNYYDKHKCSEGVFHDFCCGSIHKSKEIFEDPGTIKLQLGVDDFEVCCALKSKAGIHKVCATYVPIRSVHFKCQFLFTQYTPEHKYRL